MKRNKYLILLVLAVIFGCQDATDIVQPNELGLTNAFRNLDDVESAMFGVYSAYGPDFGSNGVGNSIYYNAVGSDNIKAGVASNGQGSSEYAYQVDITGSTASDNVWANRYATIFRANIALSALDIQTIDPAEETRANHIRGQLLGLRALSHFDLFQYYTPDYQDADGLAVINVDFIPVATGSFPRNTVAETIAFIRQDLNDAEALLDDADANASTRFFITKDVIKVLKVKLMLLEGDYANPQLMTMIDELLADYPLATTLQYTLMYLDADTTEVIFRLSRVQGTNGIGALFYFNQVDPDDAYLEASNGLYNTLDELSNDVRLGASISQPLSNIVGVNDPDNLILINKYPGSGDGLQINDIKIMRASEIQLIKAEVQARNNMLTQAATTIQELRNVRTGSPIAAENYTDTNDALLDIMEERRRELCFEGHRWLDIKRIGGDLNLGINRLDVDCESFDAPCLIPANDFRFTLGIPQAELQGNNAIQQNPGYPTN